MCNMEMKVSLYGVLGDVIVHCSACLARDYVTKLELSMAHTTAWHRLRGQRAQAESRN